MFDERGAAHSEVAEKLRHFQWPGRGNRADGQDRYEIFAIN
jgi:hypothetical protein